MTSHQYSLCFLGRKVAPPTQPQRQQLAVTAPVQTVNQAESGMYKCRCTALCINIIIFAQQYQRWQPYHYTYILQSPVFIATLLFMIQSVFLYFYSTVAWHFPLPSQLERNGHKNIYEERSFPFQNLAHISQNGKPGFKASSSISQYSPLLSKKVYIAKTISRTESGMY